MDEARADRLEKVMQRGFDTIADLLRETNERLGRVESRFDNFLGTAGAETRQLRGRVEELERRVEKLENN